MIATRYLLLQVEQEGAACHKATAPVSTSIKNQGQNVEVTELMLKSPEEIYGSKKKSSKTKMVF